MHQRLIKPQSLSFVRKFSRIKMSESEIVACSSLSTPQDEPKKKLMNSATQHGNEDTADEENIVVLKRCCSPVRETSEEVVWHEEIVETAAEAIKCEDDDVS